MLTVLKMFFVRLNMAPFGVKVLCIEPGFFKTNVTDAAILSKNVKNLWDKLPQDVKDDYGSDYLQTGEFGSSIFKSISAFFLKYVCSYSIIFLPPSFEVYTRETGKDE